MIVIFTGLPGSGKSAKLARTAIGLLYRNRKWYDRLVLLYEKDPEHIIFWNKKAKAFLPPQPRKLWTNLKLSEGVEHRNARGRGSAYLCAHSISTGDIKRDEKRLARGVLVGSTNSTARLRERHV